MLPINLYKYISMKSIKKKRIKHCHIQREINERINYNIYCKSPSLLLVIVRNHVFCIVRAYLSFTIEDVSLNLTIPIIVDVKYFDLHNFSHSCSSLWISFALVNKLACRLGQSLLPSKVQQTLKRRNMETSLHTHLMGP